MRPIYLIVSLPVFAFSLILLIFKKSVRKGLAVSRQRLSKGAISDQNIALIGYLVAGEDHRYYSHAGFDPVSILRAIARRIRLGKVEGASTIEQQYVRTCTERYEITIARKIDEIAIASILSTLERKDVIAHSYLEIAYYGRGIQGISCAKEKIRSIGSVEINFVTEEARLISLLKNPIPRRVSAAWEKKHAARATHIQHKIMRIESANTAFKRDVMTYASETHMSRRPLT